MGSAGYWRRLLAEFLGTALLAAAVVGSGITAAALVPRRAGRRAGHGPSAV
jgi:glycerol uptake facilitator-like aquaporin